MDKVVASPEQAVSDIGDGATIAVAGFGVGHRFPSSLLVALRDKGSKNLCLVCNSLGAPGKLVGQILAENGQLNRLIASFSARPGGSTESERQIGRGDIKLELVPQGTLVERLRAGGAGIPAFFTATGADTDLAEGKEVRYFNGAPHVLEQALTADFAFIRAHRADRMGNLEFRGASQNFNPSFAKAARVAIAEVDEVVETGELPPDRVGLPGIFVTRVVQRTIDIDHAALVPAIRRGGESRRDYNGKPALSRAEIARRAAMLIKDGSYVNLGAGIPVLASDYIADRDVVLHAENGMLGYGHLVGAADADPDYFNAGQGFVSLEPGASFFDSVEAFEMARSGRIDAVVLGAYQVDETGSFANWAAPGLVGGGIGGAMDLVAGSSELILVMEHVGSQGQPKLVRRCTYPLTAKDRVSVIVTDIALLERRDGVFHLLEVARGFTVDEVRDMTELSFTVGDEVGVIQDAFDDVTAPTTS